MISMNAPPIMENVHKYVPTPMEAMCVHVTLVIYFFQIIKAAMISINAPQIMETVHKYVPTPMEAMCVLVALAIC